MTKYSKTSRRNRGRGRTQRGGQNPPGSDGIIMTGGRKRTQRGGLWRDWLGAGGRKRTQRGGQNPPWQGRINIAGGRGRTQRGGQNPPWPVDAARFIPLGGRGRKRTQRGGRRHTNW